MVAKLHSVSLAELNEKPKESLDRLHATGEPEVLTVNGQARAVLLAPAAYEKLRQEAQAGEDVAVIRQSMQEIDNGQGIESELFFDGLRARLLELKSK